MIDSSFFAFASFAFVFAVTPGATTAVVVRNTLAGGRAAGMATAFGAATANAAYATVTSLGLAMMLTQWPVAFTAIRLGGGLYLAWLGVVTVSRVVRHADGGLRALGPDRVEAPPSRRATSYRQGLTFNVLNPSIAGFYLSAVPSFIPIGAPRSRFALFAGTHVVMAFACHAAWVLGLDRLRPLLARPGRRRALQLLTGLALIGLAMRVLLVSPRHV